MQTGLQNSSGSGIHSPAAAAETINVYPHHAFRYGKLKTNIKPKVLWRSLHAHCYLILLTFRRTIIDYQAEHIGSF